MLNLSQLALESPNYSLFRKVRSIRDPDIYLAESLADYHENAPLLKFPVYKKALFMQDRAYIIFKSIGIKKIDYLSKWFVLHDYSGQELVYWVSNNKSFPSMASFDRLKSEQGLKEDDWVYDVLVRYLIKQNFSSIIEVNNYPPSDKKPERCSLVERIRNFFPEFEPQLQPVW